MRNNKILCHTISIIYLLAASSFSDGIQAQPRKPASKKPKQALSQTGKALRIVPAAGPLAGRSIYTNSWALLIGINKYPNLPPDLSLHYAVKDVNDLRDELIRDYGFAPNHITVLTESQATSQRIADALDDLTDSRRVGEDDRVLVYFSGHGQTVNTSFGGDMGFLIPEDAKVDLKRPNNIGPYNRSCLSMSGLQDTLKSCPAKHVLILADACYSGLLAQSRAPETLNTAVVSEMAALRSRQVMTAGTKGQTSLEFGEYGHGAFTYKLIEQLKARAAVKGNIFTASDLFVSLQTSVSNLTNGAQLPQLASLGTEGDFLFITAGASHIQPSPPAKVVRNAPVVPAAADSETDAGDQITPVTDVLGLVPPRTIAEYKAQMAYIPGGTFAMGSNEGEENEKPVHQVTLSSFKMGRTPVTVAMWREYCSATGKSMPPAPPWGWIDDHPIISLTWYDAVDYCAWAGLMLPTEAQWEYAAKGGQDIKYPWGNAFAASNLVNKYNSAGRTAPVFRRDRVFVNSFGLVDMTGNVQQWCRDYLGAYSATAQINPSGPGSGDNDDTHILRGGSWDIYNIPFTRITHRNGSSPLGEWRRDEFGLRCVATLSP